MILGKFRFHISVFSRIKRPKVLYEDTGSFPELEPSTGTSRPKSRENQEPQVAKA